MLPSPTGPCQTSSRSLVFGLGPSITSEDGIITGAKLPTGRQILRCMLGKKPGANGALSQFEAAKVVLEQVRPFYKKANIQCPKFLFPGESSCGGNADLVNANNKLRKISQAKHSSETTAKQLEKMECRLDATFLLWPPNVEKLIDNPEDLAFLASMKTDRVGTFGVLDKKLQLKVKRREERQAAAAARQSHFEKELEEMTAMSSLELESDEESEEDTNTVYPPSEGEPSHKHKKTGTNVFIPHDILSRPSVVSLATRLKMSPMHQAAFTRGLVAESGGECTYLSASYATADRARRQVLETIREEQHKQWTPPPLCTLHWDSKLTPMLSNVRQLEERLTVVVGEAERLKLLGAPTYKKQTNEACGVIIAWLTCKLLQDWCCADQVVNMAFEHHCVKHRPSHSSLHCHTALTGLTTALVWVPAPHW
ncbi:hypothetical protein PO909_014598 [Leuciscus waleckii]